MSSARTMTLDKIESKPSNKVKQVVRRYEEIKLKKGIAIRYILKSSKLEGDYRHRATDPY